MAQKSAPAIVISPDPRRGVPNHDRDIEITETNNSVPPHREAESVTSTQLAENEKIMEKGSEFSV